MCGCGNFCAIRCRITLAETCMACLHVHFAIFQHKISRFELKDFFVIVFWKMCRWGCRCVHQNQCVGTWAPHSQNVRNVCEGATETLRTLTFCFWCQSFDSYLLLFQKCFLSLRSLKGIELLKYVFLTLPVEEELKYNK